MNSFRDLNRFKDLAPDMTFRTAVDTVFRDTQKCTVSFVERVNIRVPLGLAAVEDNTVVNPGFAG